MPHAILPPESLLSHEPLRTSVWTERRRESGRARAVDDARDAFDTDYARIIHSGSFRRLQGKTQILNIGDSDFYRTRLTHSLEVAQIAGGLVKHLQKYAPDHPAAPHLPTVPLVQTLGFAHDLGHPPFGHGGEVALNYCMRDHGGFEGNGQTLRLLSRLENHSQDHGANLTRRTLLGILKYPVAFSTVANPDCAPRLDPRPTILSVIDRQASKPPKCYLDSEQDVVDWVLAPLSVADRERFTAIDVRPGKHAKSRHKSLDCSLMDIADDIAYGVHDLEDALSLGLVRKTDFRDAVPPQVCAAFLEYRLSKYGDKVGNNAYGDLVDNLFGSGQQRKMIINIIVGHLIGAIGLEDNSDFQEPLLRYRATMAAGPATFLQALKDLVMDKVICCAQVQQMEFKGQSLVVSVFEAVATDPRAYLPSDAYAKYVAAGKDMRIICDHIAGMTDAHLMKTYERLFSPRMGSIFDKL
jgi:dGTPase